MLMINRLFLMRDVVWFINNDRQNVPCLVNSGYIITTNKVSVIMHGKPSVIFLELIKACGVVWRTTHTSPLPICLLILTNSCVNRKQIFSRQIGSNAD